MSPSRKKTIDRAQLLFVGPASAVSAKASRLITQSGFALQIVPASRYRQRSLARAVPSATQSRATRTPATLSLYAQPPVSREQIESALRTRKREMTTELRRMIESGPAVLLAAVVLNNNEEGAGVRAIAALGHAAHLLPDTLPPEALPCLGAAERLASALVLPDLDRIDPSPLAHTLGAQAALVFPLDSALPMGWVLIAMAQAGLPEPPVLASALRLATALRAMTERAGLEIQVATTQARYRSLLETIPFLMVLVADDGRVAELNRHMAAELERQEIEAAQVLGRNAFSDPLVPEELRNLLRDSLDRRTPLSLEKVSLNLPHGPETLRIHSVPLPDPAHSSWGLMVIGEVTTRYSLITAEAERTERLAAIGRVAASLAHEINNPLQSLRAHLELIRRYRLSPAEREQSLRILETEVERLDEITRRILGFARPTPEVLQPVSILAVIEQTLALSRNYLQNQHVEFVISAPKSLPPCMAAPGQLIQVFLNIILNAAHAMQGEGKLEIRVRSRGETVELAFTNNGPPIPAEYLPHLFEPFFTTRAEGTGLGLSVSHTILQRHHGTIRAANLPQGRGVVFTISLPLIHENPPAE
jgi:signal transduction histidine kinase